MLKVMFTLGMLCGICGIVVIAGIVVWGIVTLYTIRFVMKKLFG